MVPSKEEIRQWWSDWQQLVTAVAALAGVPTAITFSWDKIATCAPAGWGLEHVPYWFAFGSVLGWALVPVGVGFALREGLRNRRRPRPLISVPGQSVDSLVLSVENHGHAGRLRADAEILTVHRSPSVDVPTIRLGKYIPVWRGSDDSTVGTEPGELHAIVVAVLSSLSGQPGPATLLIRELRGTSNTALGLVPMQQPVDRDASVILRIRVRTVPPSNWDAEVTLKIQTNGVDIRATVE